MPTISMFYGIIVYLYMFDNQKHHEPHIHEEEIMANWDLAINGDTPFKIDPLK